MLISIQSMAMGAFELDPWVVLKSLFGLGEETARTVIMNIRLPRIAAALVTGWSLGLSGLLMQTLLKNPLSSPFTLGISQGAAFGASFAIIFLNAGQLGSAALFTETQAVLFLHGFYSITVCACLGGFLAAGTILALAGLKNLSPQSLILAGVALSSLFLSGTILLQYFGTEAEIATAVFWTFGDVARSSWAETALVAAVTLLSSFYLFRRGWDLNALLAGDETALSLGVNVKTLRFTGMLLASAMAALATAFNGTIAFLGLLAPHIARMLLGPDHRFLLPCSCIMGGLLLLLADTFGRLAIGSGALPVGVLTSFLGAPLFLWLLIMGGKS
ncbi:iron ABC transporter permease [Dethiosulfatarculus sandiegensis]|uniref:Iron ABC transporter permease n=1 Tax=Dethiosulfatarculus sandiegensis TaxID=1429043 RepID=A0A0D2J939_9BACT|nr:iron ABC transporter permease [Dethiosulfatarculus sandiegensis]